MNKVLLFLIFVLTIGLRLYRIDAPLGDWHSWRQSDTAAVARNFIKFGFDPSRPRYDDLSSIPSGKDNPMGYRMVEFPLYQLIGAALFKTFGQFSIEVWLRLVTVVAAAGTAVLLARVNILAGFMYAVLPYSIYFGRTILPETLAVFLAILSLSLLPNRLVLAAIAGALALLVKPTAIFLLIPSLLFLKKNLIGLFEYWIIGLLPFIWWRQWIANFPEGIPANMWLLNGNGIRFKGAWFHWIFAKRIGELILGYWGLIPFGLGIAGSFIQWGLGPLLYLIVFATGNVQHDYYQILLLPSVAIFVGKGLGKIPWFLATISFLFMLAFSWYTIRTYYWINRPDIVEAGKLADQILPKDAKVIAPYNGDTTFLYQTNRQGWPIGFDIEKKLMMGATAYVTVSPTDNDTETKQLANCFTVLVRNDRYAIIDLTKPVKSCTITNP